MASGVYIIRRIDSEDCYVGSSVSIEHRWRGHKKSLHSGRHHSPYLQRAWAKHGETAFEFVVIEECERADLVGREQHYIDTLRSVYNFARASRGPVGVTRSAETRAKLRAANLGRSPTNKGVSPTPEQRARRRANQPNRKGIHNFAARGRKATAETRMKMSLSRLGQKKSQEWRAKISAANMGNQPPWTGGTRPPDVGAKISATKRLKPYRHTAEALAKMSAQRKGRKRCPDTVAKVAAALRGRQRPAEYCARQSERMAAWWAARKAAEGLV